MPVVGNTRDRGPSLGIIAFVLIASVAVVALKALALIALSPRSAMMASNEPGVPIGAPGKPDAP
jgi:hypothetical protein